jgi:hypothetical protein
MRFTILTAVVVTLASPTLAATCRRIDNGGAWEYAIDASGVPDIPGTCGGLWDNLKRFAACPVMTLAECSTLLNGNLRWGFLVGKGCNGG